MPQAACQNVGLMSLKAGAHQLNLTNSIEAVRPVKTKKLEIIYSQQLLSIHYWFVSRSQENGGSKAAPSHVAPKGAQNSKGHGYL
jgi:hypothetical protein